MSVRTLCSFLLSALLLLGVGTSEARAQLSVGGGIHYLRNLGDITNDGQLDLSQNSIAIQASAKRSFGLISIDGQLGYIFNYLGTDESAWEPAAWALVGGLIYGGGGIGWQHSNSEWSDPFYALRGGVDLPLGGLELDAYATWRFQSSDDFENLTGEDLDSLTFAALLRFML